MSERTKLLKKAVLTGVGASTNVDRVKRALNEALEDLVKVGQDLIDDLESKGKDRADTIQSFLQNFKGEAAKRAGELESKVSSKVKLSMKNAARECGLVTHADFEELADRIASLEEALVGGEEEIKRSRRSKKSTHD